MFLFLDSYTVLEKSSQSGETNEEKKNNRNFAEQINFQDGAKSSFQGEVY